MEVSNTFRPIGSPNLHIINLSKSPQVIDFKVHINSKTKTGEPEKSFADIAITVDQNQEATYDKSTISNLALKQLGFEVDDYVLTTSGQATAIDALRGVTSENCALAVIKQGSVEKTLLVLNDDESQTLEDITELCAQKFPDAAWKVISLENHFYLNPEMIKDEFEKLKDRETMFSQVPLNPVFRNKFGTSFVDIVSSHTKAGKAEELFTGDPKTSFIPKTLHQIYLGCDPDSSKASRLPLNFERFVESWLEKNRLSPGEEGWEHIIWTVRERWKNDEDFHAFHKWCEEKGIIVKDLADTYRDQEDWQKLEEVVHTSLDKKNWGLASDIARFIVLKEEGGVYADLDIECHHRLDHTEVMNADFFMGLGEESRDIWSEGAIMGAQKRSKVFTKGLEMIREYQNNGLMEAEGINGHSTIYMTGPLFLTLVLSDVISELSFPRIYPPSTFYPEIPDGFIRKKNTQPSSACIAFHSSTKSWSYKETPQSMDHEKTWQKVTENALKRGE